MGSEESAIRRAAAAEQFNLHEGRTDGVQIASSLSGGLTILRDSLYTRIHIDVQHRVGQDSMLMPVSEEKTERTSKLEIELFQITVAATAAQQQGYVGREDDWYLQWMCRMRLGQINSDGRVSKRLDYYLSKTPEGRRLAFTNVLASALPESRRAPLVLFRLLPPAVEIVVALAFCDHDHAGLLRAAQADCLPPVRDCHHCRGKLLDNGEQCPACGNPLWKFDWLTAAD